MNSITKNNNSISGKFAILFSLAISMLIVLSIGCQESGIASPESNSDLQLLQSIQDSPAKETIDVASLPSAAQSTLSEYYNESFVTEASLVPQLGYEVNLRRGEGSRMGEHSQTYFDMNGRELLSNRGNMSKNGMKGKMNNGRDRKECFTLVFPVTFIMPDGSTITGDEKEEVRLAMKSWFQENPDLKARPTLQFPVDIQFADGTVVTINNQDEMKIAFEDCHADGKVRPLKRCFKFVLPITQIMPDGSSITINTTEDWALVKDWYKANPNSKEKPTLQFPVDIILKNGTILTINNQDEMKDVIERCKAGHNHPPKRCFELVLPVTQTMPDGSLITITTKDDWSLIKDWYKANPGTKERPTLQFPIEIVFEDESTLTINNKDQMKEAISNCGKNDSNGHGN